MRRSAWWAFLCAALLSACSKAPPPAAPVSETAPSPPVVVPVGIGTIAFATTTHGFRADDTVIYATGNGGATWSPKISLPEPVLHLDLISPSQGWAATQSGLFVTRDGGHRWAPVPGEAALRVDFVDERHGWAFSTSSGLIVTRDGGDTWAPVENPCSQARWSSRAFSFISRLEGWMLCTAQPGAGTQEKALFHTDDAGLTWAQVAAAQRPPEGASSLPLGGYGSDLHFVDQSTGWLGHTRGSLLVTRDGGRSWQGVPLPPVGQEHFIRAVRFLTPAEGYVLESAGGPGALLHTADGGDTWNQVQMEKAGP